MSNNANLGKVRNLLRLFLCVNLIILCGYRQLNSPFKGGNGYPREISKLKTAEIA